MEPELHGQAIDAALLLDSLLAILPPEAVLHQPEALAAYECDGLSAYRRRPLVVCLPETVDEVRRILRLCHQHEVPAPRATTGTSCW